jgi:Protein of unknown function (DUF993)
MSRPWLSEAVSEPEGGNRQYSAAIRLPGRPEPLLVTDPGWDRGYPPPASRSVFAAAHVAARPGGEIDWESTLGFRDFLWDYGFGVAEAMDTAQRGMGLSWAQARELIARSAARAAERGTVIACGAGTDQLPPGRNSLSAIVAAYEAQLELVQSAGAGVILMASRAMAASARSAQDYLDVYLHLLRQADRPVILHWLGPAFDPALAGYWGAEDFGAAADVVIRLAEHADGKVAGIKLSVLDAGREVALRRRLPAGVRLYTGDDFHYDELIRGDAPGATAAAGGGDAPGGAAAPGGNGWGLAAGLGSSDTPGGAAAPGGTGWGSAAGLGTGGAPTGRAGHSDALLGAFAAVTAPAAAALRALDAADMAGYDAAIGPTMPLSRVIFEEPTSRYKVGVAFLAWLNGLQPHFVMLGDLQRQRGRAHLVRVFELAAGAGALLDPDLAVSRMTGYLATAAGP